MSYANKTIRSSIWNVILGFTNQASSLIVFVILSRFLSVEDFGLVALCFLITEMLVSLSGFGVNQLLIQRPKWNSHLASACMVVIFVLSICFSLVMTLVIAPVTELYFYQGSWKYLVVLAIVPIIYSLSAVSTAKLLRDFNNKQVTLINSSTTILSSIVTVVLIYFGFEIWSVVFGRLIQCVLATILFQISFPFFPKLTYRKAHYRKIVDFGLPVFGQTFLTFILSRVVNFVSLFTLGAAAFAFVSIAQRAIRLAKEITITPLNAVLLQSFSRVIKSDKFEQTYQRIVKVSSFIIYPMFIGLATVGKEFVEIFFGDQWDTSGDILTILSFTTIFMLPTWFLPTILIAKGQTGKVFKINLIGASITIVTSAIGATYSVIGLAVGAVISSFVVAVYKILVIRRIVAMNYIKVILCCLPAFVSAMLMFLIVNWIGAIYLTNQDIYISLIIKVFMGCVLYSIFSLTLFTKNTLYVFNEIKHIKK